MRKRTLTPLLLLSLTLFVPQLAIAQGAAAASNGVAAASNQTATASNEISADLGSCSALITVTGLDSKPVYTAKVHTRIQYGFMSVKRLDLDAFTDLKGQVKITHLPLVLKKPMYIYISKNDEQEIVEFKPSVHCEATFDVLLR